MAIGTYAELQTAIGNWMDRDDLSSRIPEFITLGESRINRDLRIRMMETTSTVTIDAQTEALPTGFLNAKRFYIDGTPDQVMEFVTPDVFWGINASQITGKPKYFTIEGGNFVFGPSPDTTYSGKLLWYSKLTAVSSTTSGNTLFSDHPDIYLYSALAEGFHYLQEDNEAQKYDALYQRAVKEVLLEDVKSRHTGSVLVTKPNRTVY